MAWEPFEEDDFWFGEGVPTFTAEEYIYSTMFPNPVRIWTDRTGEAAMYFAVNMWMAVYQAYRKMGDTYTAYKWMKTVQMAPSAARFAARFAVRSVPLVAATGVVMVAARDVTQSTVSNLAVVSGVPGAQPSKPWWMPLYVYHAMYS